MAKVKIKNATDYDTRSLKKLFRLCAEQNGNERVNVLVSYSKSQVARTFENNVYLQRIHGWAYYHSTVVKMMLPRTQFLKGENTQFKIEVLHPEAVREIAQVFIHELDHNLGLKHKDMKKISDIEVDFCNEVKIGLKKSAMAVEVKSAKAKKDVKVVRYEKALAKKEEYERKAKRIKNLLKKWSDKVRYYERAYGYNSEK